MQDLTNHMYPELKVLTDLMEECEHAKSALYGVFNLRFSECYMSATGRIMAQEFAEDLEKILLERVQENQKEEKHQEQLMQLDQEVERRLQARLAELQVFAQNQQGGDGTVAMQVG